MPKLIITIDAKDKSEAYKAVTQLGIFTKVESVEVDGEVWVFETAEDLKYFNKRNYLRLETGEQVNIT